jgi:hypothetical protein
MIVLTPVLTLELVQAALQLPAANVPAPHHQIQPLPEGAGREATAVLDPV